MPFILNQICHVDPAKAGHAAARIPQIVGRYTDITGLETVIVLRHLGCETTSTFLVSALLPTLDHLTSADQPAAGQPARIDAVGQLLGDMLVGPVEQELFQLLHAPDAPGPENLPYFVALRAHAHIGHEADTIDVARRQAALIARHQGQPGWVATSYTGRWLETLAIATYPTLDTFAHTRAGVEADPEQTAIIAAAEGCIAAARILLYERVA
jgi:hypothetical protein